MVLTVDVRIQDQIILIITHLKKQRGYKYLANRLNTNTTQCPQLQCSNRYKFIHFADK